MKLEIKIYNSLSRRKELLPHTKKLRLFVCGPTVYEDAHIGHARTYIFFDFFMRYLRSLGHNVIYVQNITNIDDKIIGRAKKEKRDPLRLADILTKRYFADMKALGVSSVSKYALATKFIPQIIKQVRTLIKKGYAYEIPGDGYYFDVSRFKNYGKLSGRTLAQAEDAVSRIDESIKKRNRADFCLWKYSKPGDPSWPSPWGPGRPGWHIEDTAISEHYFGPQYELHGGGLDLKFPHHEAEIAQQEAASGKKPFVKIWMHAGMVTVDKEKMSKSLGNFITIKYFLKSHGAEALRLAFFSHHYRSPLDYSRELIKNSEHALQGVELFLAKLDFVRKAGGPGKEKLNASAFSQNFEKALQDDINTPIALAALFNAINKANPLVWQFDKKSALGLKKFIESSFGLLGITFKTAKTPKKLASFAKRREQFRANKQFIQADRLRKKVSSLGYVIEDTPLGPFLWPRYSAKRR